MQLFSGSLMVVLASVPLILAQEPPPTTSSPAEFPDVVARVNGVEILRSDLLRRADAMKAQMPSFEVRPDFYQRILAEMVNGELLYQSVEAKGLAPTEEELEAEMSMQVERFGGKEAFEEALASQGVAVETFRVEIKKEIGIQKFVENELIPKINVSEEDKRKFYDENQADMQRPMQFRAAHILIGVDEGATEEEKVAAKTKARGILSMLDAGQDFEELAERNSDDPGSKESGGELPWMSQGQTVAPFEAAALALEPGELSPVVETQFGYHIIRLIERRDAGARPYEEVEERIDRFLQRRDLEQQIEEELRGLRSTGSVEVFI